MPRFVLMFASVSLAAVFAAFTGIVPMSPATSQPTPATNDGSQCATTNTAFNVGEKLTYKVYYNLNFVWVPAGEVTFEVKDEGTMYHLVALGRTYSSYEWFFKVRDRYESYVDKKTLLPTLSIRDMHEGSFDWYSRQAFDNTAKNVTVLEGGNLKDAQTTQHPLKGCAHDILSIIYYARNVDQNTYRKDDRVPIQVFIDKQTWKLNVHYKGKETRRYIRDAGYYNTYSFSPELIKGGTFKDTNQMLVQVSDDANRVPLEINSPLSVGSVKVVLVDAKGLRNPTTAKVK